MDWTLESVVVDGIIRVPGICEACRFAYANACFSVPREDRTWIRRIERGAIWSLDRAYQVYIYRVRQCTRFEAGRTPLPDVSPANHRWALLEKWIRQGVSDVE